MRSYRKMRPPEKPCMRQTTRAWSGLYSGSSPATQPRFSSSFACSLHDQRCLCSTMLIHNPVTVKRSPLPPQGPSNSAAPSLAACTSNIPKWKRPFHSFLGCKAAPLPTPRPDSAALVLTLYMANDDTDTKKLLHHSCGCESSSTPLPRSDLPWPVHRLLCRLPASPTKSCEPAMLFYHPCGCEAIPLPSPRFSSSGACSMHP